MRLGTWTMLLLLASAPVLRAQERAAAAITPTQAVATALATPNTQVKLADCADAVRPLRWAHGTSLLYTADGLQLHGEDDSGHAWTVTVPAGNVMKCEVWSAHLIDGLPPDLLLLNADEMGGYQSELTIFFFDSNGRPHPWQATGAFTSNAAGIRQVAMDPATRNARIVVPVREGDRFSGYVYVQSLLRLSAAGINKVAGSSASAVWPQISGNRAMLGGTETNITESETFDAGQSSGPSLTSVGPPDSDAPLTLSDGRKIRTPKMIVIVAPDQSRRIFLDGNTPVALAEIRQRNLSFQLEGTSCDEEECRPFLMVAEQK